MLVLRKMSEVKQKVAEWKSSGKTIGFVPTMGALHQGHLSLIEASKTHTDYTVCSIFVNPTQFNNPTDLSRYPKTPEADMILLEAAQCDLLYIPDVSDVYPKPSTAIFNFGYLESILEGEHRPGHFNGVGQVVSILFHGILPDKAFFGSKDYQQVMIIKSLVRQLHLPVEVVSCPIKRENDGLAMSSRNTLLTSEERKIASLIPKLMQAANDIVISDGIDAAKEYVNHRIEEQPLMKLDYFEVCDADSLNILSEYNQKRPSVSLIAVFVGKIRLIDNWMIT